ncbi:cytochrome d ubiquinol oxidase subunit II [Curtobacterium herbarum]|uniref:Cytochrome d ubiquinol oxidase subunit II n=1 Tax=Curtobacterium herbarum TaxID=150122 RepID=A0ABN1ZDG3_9MICO|nr:cytochrome d ubiquinol oxidase subunit II [Curtobacterium herbarum]MBM7475753.1 cytochrome d ubiquinol oxidase subunit II [Curtobacterium herbarum]MCS6543664.1 cytochrome d ubiquinol oxidase subunit II [Curtobacterium herbarum]
MDLPVLWFAIVGLFFVGYFVLDGFDFGVGMSLPFLGRDDTDRRVLINTIGPVWDLNETWVIVAGACLFAAFPEWYATMFSGFYLALLFILAALILRGVSFEYRHQNKHLAWKRRFDLMIVVGSAVPSFLWGVAFGNVVRGIPMDSGHNYTGTLFDLLNPFALLAGATTLLVFFTHGVVFVALKTEGEMRERAMRLAKRAGVVTIVVAAVFLVTMALVRSTPTSLVLSVIAAVALVVAVLCAARGREGRAFALMAVTIAAVVVAMFTAVFPDVMPATNDPANSLTVANASSGTYTLTVMSWVALVCVPLVLAYQAWTYWIFRKRVSRATVAQAAH